MPGFKDLSRRALKKAGGKLLEAADRADERAGEIRDQLKERLKNAQHLAGLNQSWTQRNVDPDAENESDHEPLGEGNLVSKTFSYSDETKPAQVFGARSCPWSGRALRLLEAAGVHATYLDLDHPGSGPIRDELRVETGQLTVPYVYLRGQFIGGFNALDEIHRLGQLDYLVLTEEERKVHPDHGKFEIAKRASSVDAPERPPE